MPTESFSRSSSNDATFLELEAMALARRRELEIALNEIDDLIKTIRAIRQKSERNSESPQLRIVLPGHYKGMHLREALQAYLLARPGIRITHERAAEDLWAGGAEWPDRGGRGAKGRLHNFKMSCAMNSDLVEQDKKAGLLWLIPEEKRAEMAKTHRARDVAKKKEKARSTGARIVLSDVPA